MRHIQGQSRYQTTLIPESLDELIPRNHPVRVIDAFVDMLDLTNLGFIKAIAKKTGRPPYHPGDLLKLYLYGYLNQIRSSRGLEKESHRNMEVLWLINRLSPDFKTIADFRKENSLAIQQACREFILFCREQALFGSELVAIDGSKFQAASSKKQCYTLNELKEQNARVEQSINDYLQALEQSEDQSVIENTELNVTQDALTALQQRKDKLKKLQQKMDETGQKAGCMTEEDARLMRSSQGQTITGYNVQTAVDSKHSLIICHEVTQESNDTRQLFPMACQAKEVLKVKELQVVADAGYSNGEHAHYCEEANIQTYVPTNRAINTTGNFDKSAFSYDEKKDAYLCPAGEWLHHKTVATKDKLHLYTNENCGGCSLKSQCTSANKRWVSRHFYEDALNRMEIRAQQNSWIMKKRRSIVEHPFGTLKRMMGNRRFLTRGLNNVKGEMALSILAYNFLRVINILGVSNLITKMA